MSIESTNVHFSHTDAPQPVETDAPQPHISSAVAEAITPEAQRSLDISSRSLEVARRALPAQAQGNGADPAVG